jgi:hypothetical protein
MLMGYVIIIPLITNRKENMQYFILRKIKLWGKYEYSTESKADNGYATIDEAIKRKVALETLNTNKDVSYILVNDGTPSEEIIERLEEENMEHDQERANHIAKSVNRGEL